MTYRVYAYNAQQGMWVMRVDCRTRSEAVEQQEYLWYRYRLRTKVVTR